MIQLEEIFVKVKLGDQYSVFTLDEYIEAVVREHEVPDEVEYYRGKLMSKTQYLKED